MVPHKERPGAIFGDPAGGRDLRLKHCLIAGCKSDHEPLGHRKVIQQVAFIARAEECLKLVKRRAHLSQERDLGITFLHIRAKFFYDIMGFGKAL